MSHFASTWSIEVRSIRAAIVPTRRAQPRRPAIERLAEMRMLQQLSRHRVARLAADIDMIEARTVWAHLLRHTHSPSTAAIETVFR
jgi:hypothetical protein